MTAEVFIKFRDRIRFALAGIPASGTLGRGQTESDAVWAIRIGRSSCQWHPGRIICHLSFVICLLSWGAVAADGFFERGWGLRRELTVETAGQGGALRPVAVADLPTLGKAQASADFRVTDSGGREVKSAVLASGFEDRALVAFEAAAKGKYWIYFDNPKATASTMKLDASAAMTLEVRELPSGDPDSWEDAQKMIAAAKPLGKAMWPRLEVSFNPFGAWGRGIYIFRGILDCPADGQYGFQSNAQAASFLLIDGKLVIDWPGWHNAKKPRGKNNAGEVDLKKGPHSIEYVNIFNAHGACLAGWKKPGDRGFTQIGSTEFAGVHFASVGAAESRAGAVADFDWKIESDMGMDGRPLTEVQFKLNSKGKRVKWDFGDGAVSFADAPEHIFIAPGVYKVTCEVDGRTATQNALVRPRHGGRGRQYERRVVEYASVMKDYPLDGFSEHACFEIAQICHESGKYDAAVKAFRAAFEKGWKPRDAEEAWWPHRVYDLYRDAGKYDDAVWVCDWIAKTLGPNEGAQAMNMKAEILYDYQDNIDAAADVCRKTLEKYGQVNSDYVRLAYIRLGEYQLARGERASAKTSLEEAQNSAKWKKWSGDIEVTEGAHELNFTQYLRAREYEAAMKEIASLEWKTPTIKLTGETRFMRGKVLMARQMYGLALKEFERAMNADRKAPFADELLYLRAQAYEGLKDSAKAKECFAKLVKDFPESNFAISAREKVK